MADAYRDQNFVATLIASSSVDGKTPVRLYADPTTHRLLVDLSAIASLFNTETFTSTNNQTIFTVSKTPAYTIYVSINGAIQTPNSDYTLAGSTYTLANGIPAGSIVVILYSTA